MPGFSRALRAGGLRPTAGDRHGRFRVVTLAFAPVPPIPVARTLCGAASGAAAGLDCASGNIARGGRRMTNRAKDWMAQAERDLAHARDAQAAGRHEWACFAAQQAAEKAVKALHLALGQEAWGYVIAQLMRELPIFARPQVAGSGSG